MDIAKLLQNFDPGNKQQVKALQQALQAQGYDVTPDGQMGPNTAKAIGEWRKGEEDASTRELEGRKIDQRAKEKSWQNQAIEGAKWSAIPLGIGYGAYKAKKIEGRQMATQRAQASGQIPDAPRSWGSVRRFGARMGPYAGAGALYAGEGAALREFVAPHIQNETGQEFARAGGTGLMGASIGMTSSGLINSFTPKAAPGTPPGTPPPGSLPPGTPDNALSRAAPPQGLPPPGTPPAAPPSPPPPVSPSTNSERLARAAREAGATGKMTKAQAAQYLAGNVTAENRAAVARELGVKPGPNFATRLSGKVRTMASTTRRVPSIAAPIIAAGVAYDAAKNAAEARGAGFVEQTATGAGAATVAGGTTAAAMKAGQYLSKVPGVGAAARFLGKASGPMMLSEGAADLTRLGIERGYLRDPAQMDQPPANALSSADPGGSDFGQALDAFMQFVTQQMAEQGQQGEEMQVSP